MKKIIFYLSLLISLSSQAYLYSGLSLSLDDYVSNKRTALYLELCPVEKVENNSKCLVAIQKEKCELKNNEAGVVHWVCLNNSPGAFRFNIAGQSYPKNFYFPGSFPYEGTNPHFVLVKEDNQVMVKQMPKAIIIKLSMQEMLENVFFPKEVQQIRKEMNPRSWDIQLHTDTKMSLKTCEQANCLGKNTETHCALAILGLKEINAQCDLTSFARFMMFTLEGKDKKRTSKIIPINEKVNRYQLLIRSEAELVWY